MKYIASSFLIIIFVLSSATIKAASSKDQQIIHSIQQLLKKEHDIPKIKISSKNGIVELVGTVETSMQAHHIVEIASSIHDVIDINTDKLEVKSSREFLSDAFITAKAKGKIKYLSINHKISPDYKLHIETTNRIVHILGNVTKKQDIKIIKDSVNDIIDVDSVKINIICE